MGIFTDLTGNKYGKLTVVSLHSRENGKVKWNCLCECGNTTVAAGNNLKNGHTSSCGCAKHAQAANLIDLTGKTFGRLTVLRRGDGRNTSGGNYKATWICKCECGKETEVDGEKLRKGHTTSCGCLKTENKGAHFEDLTGKRFNRLTVIRFLGKDERTSKQYNWLCKCDCGNYTKADASRLKTGAQQSCGCLKEEMKPRLGEITRKYKYSNKRLYSVYKAMIDRCYNGNSREYNNYGGRGVRVCDGWLGEYGYDYFAEWAFANGYDPDAPRGKCTLDRTDVNGCYCPENCRFIPNQEQQNNRRDNVLLEYKGETHTLTEWSRKLNIPTRWLRYYCRDRDCTIAELLDILGR